MKYLTLAFLALLAFPAAAQDMEESGIDVLQMRISEMEK